MSVCDEYWGRSMLYGWNAVNSAKRHGDQLRADFHVFLFVMLDCDFSYVLHGLNMARCNTVMPVISRGSYGTHLLDDVPGRAELAVDAGLAQLVQQVFVEVALVVIGVFLHQLIHSVHAVHHPGEHQGRGQLEDGVAHVLTIGAVLVAVEVLDEGEDPLLHDGVHPPGVKVVEYRPLQLATVDLPVADLHLVRKDALIGQTQHGTLLGAEVVGGIQIMDKHQVSHLLDDVQRVGQTACPENLPQAVYFVF